MFALIAFGALLLVSIAGPRPALPADVARPLGQRRLSTVSAEAWTVRPKAPDVAVRIAGGELP